MSFGALSLAHGLEPVEDMLDQQLKRLLPLVSFFDGLKLELSPCFESPLSSFLYYQF